MLEQRGDIVVIGVMAFGNVRIFFSVHVFAELLVKLNLRESGCVNWIFIAFSARFFFL